MQVTADHDGRDPPAARTSFHPFRCGCCRMSVFAPGSARPVEIEVAAARAGVAGKLELDAPAGWEVAPATQPFQIASIGDRARFTFTVPMPARQATAGIMVCARIGGRELQYAAGGRSRYDHIPPPTASAWPQRLKAVALDLAVRGRQIGYLPGAGDRRGRKPGADGLQGHAACWSGPHAGAASGPRCRGDRNPRVQRADRPRPGALPRPSVEYVEAGGNVIVHCNRPNGLHTKQARAVPTYGFLGAASPTRTPR